MAEMARFWTTVTLSLMMAASSPAASPAASAILAVPAPGFAVLPGDYNGPLSSQNEGFVSGLLRFLKGSYDLKSAWLRTFSKTDYSEQVAIELFILANPRQASQAFEQLEPALKKAKGAFERLNTFQLPFPKPSIAQELKKNLLPTDLYAVQAAYPEKDGVFLIQVESYGKPDTALLKKVASEQYFYALNKIPETSPDLVAAAAIAALIGLLFALAALATYRFAFPRKGRKNRRL